MRRVALVVLAILALTTGCTATTSPGVAPSSTAPALVTVPDVVGLNAAVAVDTLKRVGFSNVDLGTVDGHKFVALPQNWTVKTQSARPGDRLPRDAKIVLGCARNS
jgi:beta-lactam-binding protein with PASTA domain